jgi:hypothetical protein
MNKSDGELNKEMNDLLKKMLILQLFQMGVPQVKIAKKLTMDVGVVNRFLKGISRYEPRNK